MGIFTRVLTVAWRWVIRILTFPFRMVARLFFGTAGTTARKTLGNVAAYDSVAREARKQKPSASNAFLFRILDRPKLAEQSASDLTLDSARRFVGRAHRFYATEFNLFPRSSLFYEEVELEELSYALSADDPNSTDSRFVIWMDLFRRTLNGNARRLLTLITPLVFVAASLSADALCRAFPVVTDLPLSPSNSVPSAYVFFPAAMVAGLSVLVLVYQWPFKVINQRNLLGLDNYITSRFSRINQNYQVAKRLALNVERNKRMAQAEELKAEAGVWTVAYNWFAIRLYLCERVVRNQMYQVARNATLYAVGGVLLVLLLAALMFAGWAFGAHPTMNIAPMALLYGGSAVAYAGLAYTLVLGGAPAEAARVLSDNEWFRFGGAELSKTIADHVGEDKLQIVTFRDRNRME